MLSNKGQDHSQLKGERVWKSVASSCFESDVKRRCAMYFVPQRISLWDIATISFSQLCRWSPLFLLFSTTNLSLQLLSSQVVGNAASHSDRSACDPLVWPSWSVPRFKMLSAQVFVSHRLKLGPDLRVPAHLKLDLVIPQAHSCLPSSARLWDLSVSSSRTWPTWFKIQPLNWC